jgi:hypothetical protein
LASAEPVVASMNVAARVPRTRTRAMRIMCVSFGHE